MRKTVLFDLDGTLTDSRPGIVRCIQHALASLGRPVPAEESLLWCIGPPLRGSFVRLLGGEAQADRAVSLYRERFGDVGIYENRLYDGIPELLEALREQDVAIHLATSKLQVYAQRILDHFGIGYHFDAVFGAGPAGERADKTELLAWVLEQTGADPIRTTMIGDRSHDMIGARNNGIAGVGVLYGYGSHAELVEGGASRVVAEPHELIGVLQDG